MGKRENGPGPLARPARAQEPDALGFPLGADDGHGGRGLGFP
jgi:hypothetical protein